MPDVRLFHTPDGGELELRGGQLFTAEGLETAVYLSLFGGNIEDRGQPNSPKQWWGNIDEQVEARKLRSETQHLIQSLPAVPASLKRIQAAAERDLAWLATEIASGVLVQVTMPGAKRIRIDITVFVNTDTRYQFSFETAWEARA